MSESAFNELCSQIRIEEGPKGTVLFKQGDQKNEFVYLLAGTISLQAAGMEMDTISGGSEEARFALAHQIPRKVFAVAKDRIRFLRINADFLNSITSKQQDAASYEVSDIPEESSGDWMTTLLKSPIFQRLPAANLQKVLTSMEEIEVKAGELVVKQGEPGDFYYIIKKGRCSLTRRPSRNAKEIKLAELKTTETFGEDSLISGAPRNVNITMLTDGVLLRLSKENFLEYVKKPVIEAVSVDQAIDAVEKGAVLLDVRTPDTFEHGHIDGSRNIPFFSLRMQLSGLDPAKKLIVICEDGNTSEAACFLLIRYALDAVVLAGGFNAVPQQYATSFCRQAQIPAVEPSQESQESLESGESQESPIGSPEVSVADETRALEESRQIIAQLQHQLLIEQEKRKSAEQKQTQSKPNQESDGQELSDLRKQIEALNRECAKAANSAEDYRLRMEAAENKLAESNQVAKGAKQEADRSGAQLNAKLQSLEIELQNRQTELEKALSQSTVNQKEIETLRAKLGDYEIQLGDLDETVRAKSATLEKELSAKRVIEANLSRLEKERSEQIAKLGEKATQAEKRVSALQKELEQSLQTCQLLEKQKGELATAQSGKVETLLEEKQAFEK
ncbi:MAG: cyclic nucleotide-binding domain-containing protein, partial [Gammaproteobacteria bacterium]